MVAQKVEGKTIREAKTLTVDEIAAKRRQIECDVCETRLGLYRLTDTQRRTIEQQAEQITRLQSEKREIENAAFERAARWCEREDIDRDPDDLYSGRKHRAAAIRAFIQPPAQKGRT